MTVTRATEHAGAPDLSGAAVERPVAAWFAARTRSRHEKLVAEQWRGVGLDFWLPLLRLRKRWSDRYVHVEEPLFPGYLFLHGGAEARLTALRARGVIQFVGFGDGPAAVPAREIQAIRQALSSGLQCDPCPYLKVGQEVEVARGALRGHRGILESKRGCHRLVLSVPLIGQSVAVEVSPADVRAYG